MKTLLFLLFPCICFAQITQRDTIVDIGGTLYLQHIITSSELLVDTLKIRARIDEIDKTIIELQAEREKKVALISDLQAQFEDIMGGMSIMGAEKLAKPAKQPAPKKKPAPKKVATKPKKQ